MVFWELTYCIANGVISSFSPGRILAGLMELGLSRGESSDGRVLCTQFISGNKGYLISLMQFCCLQMIAQSLPRTFVIFFAASSSRVNLVARKDGKRENCTRSIFCTNEGFYESCLSFAAYTRDGRSTPPYR